MKTAELCELGVVEITTAVASGSLRVSALVDALLQQIAAVDGTLQAWCYVDADSALAEAARLDLEAAAGRLRGPLHGVPVGLKDVFHAAGMPTLAGSRALDGGPEPEDATATARLRAAGAVILGKLHTAEFALADPPPTRNPWNTAHTAGGSSSGSGAAVAARMVPAALGTQTGGSTLRPAAYNGVAGLKPTFGRISCYGVYPVSWSLDHPGIIARSVADLAALYRVLAGPDPRDPNTLGLDVLAGSSEGFSASPRLGVLREFFYERSDPEMRAAFDVALAWLQDAGATIVELPLPAEFARIQEAQRTIMRAELALAHRSRYAEHKERMGPRLVAAVEDGMAIAATDYVHAQRTRTEVRTRMRDLFAEIDCLLMPTAPGPAPAGLDSTGDASLLSPWSFVGFPALSTPCGLSSSGLPLGAQIVAPPLEEELLFRVGAWCESVLGRLPVPESMTASASV